MASAKNGRKSGAPEKKEDHIEDGTIKSKGIISCDGKLLDDLEA